MINKNKNLFKLSQKLIPGGVNSPVRAFASVGGTPIFFKKALGSRLWDENGKEYMVGKLCTENNELYGSVKPTEISKLIKEKNKVDIKPSMIQPIDEIKSLGKFKVKINLHSEVDSEITINVLTAETIQ